MKISETLKKVVINSSPLLSFISDKSYRDYVRKNFPRIFKIVTNVIATKGASLNESNLTELLLFIIEDPRTSPVLKKWANNLINSPEGKSLFKKVA